MESKRKYLICTALGVAPAAPAAFAAVTAMPPQMRQGSVGYVSGGIGAGEARRFEQAFAQHPLAIELLEHAGKREEFTANAHVRILDRQGHAVLDTRAGGPFMLVDLKPGRYSIVATLGSQTLRKRAAYVHAGTTARATFEFPSSAD
jgi:hypothetical protein